MYILSKKLCTVPIKLCMFIQSYVKIHRFHNTLNIYDLKKSRFSRKENSTIDLATG